MQKGINGMLIFLVSLVVVWLILGVVFPQVASVSTTGLMGLLAAGAISAGVLALLKSLKIANLFPYKTSVLTAVIILAAGLFFGGLLPGLSVPSIGAPAATALPTATVATQVSSATDCEASVAPDIKGTSATVTLNAYDLESNTPYSAAVDAGTVFVFRTAKLADGDSTNFVVSTSDTTANGVTGFKTGEVISMAGGNTTGAGGRYYIETAEGICLKGQQNSVNLNAHLWETDAEVDTTIYDSTSSVELGAGTVGLDYTAAQGASSEITYYWRIRPNSADNALWLGGVGLSVFQNITSAQPVGAGAGLFSIVPTPNYLRDINFPTAAEAGGGGGNNMTRTYTIYKLKNSLLMHEFDEFKFPFSVRASSNDPTGAPNTTTWSGVTGIVLDQAYVRGADGRMYLDIHDHANLGSEANVGLGESVSSPNGGTSGFALTIT